MYKFKLSLIYLFSYIILLVSWTFKMLNVNITIANKCFEIGIAISVIINIILMFFNRVVRRYFTIFILLLLLFIIGIILHFNIISSELLILFVLLSNINLLNLHEFVKVDIYTKSILIFSAILLYFSHVTHVTNAKGNSLGFSDPNEVGSIIFSIICSLSLLIFEYNFNNHKTYDNTLMCMSTLLIFIFYVITQCRALVYSGLFIIIFIILGKSKIIRHFVFKLSIPFELFLLFIVMYCVYAFNSLNKSWYIINEIFSKRLIMQSLLVHLYPLKFSGQTINIILRNLSHNFTFLSMSGISNADVDNSYLMLGYRYGIIGLIIAEFIFVAFTYTASKYKEYIPCVLVLSLSLYFCVENSFISAYNIAPILYVVSFALKRKSITKIGKRNVV